MTPLPQPFHLRSNNNPLLLVSLLIFFPSLSFSPFLIVTVTIRWCFWQTNLSRNNDVGGVLDIDWEQRRRRERRRRRLRRRRRRQRWRRRRGEWNVSNHQPDRERCINVSPRWIACSVLPCSSAPSSSHVPHPYLDVLVPLAPIHHLCLSNHPPIRSLVYSPDLSDDIDAGGEPNSTSAKSRSTWSLNGDTDRFDK